MIYDIKQNISSVVMADFYHPILCHDHALHLDRNDFKRVQT